jgi:hypothetical protein
MAAVVSLDRVLDAHTVSRDAERRTALAARVAIVSDVLARRLR